jgi:hypothetical protein
MISNAKNKEGGSYHFAAAGLLPTPVTIAADSQAEAEQIFRAMVADYQAKGKPVQGASDAPIPEVPKQVEPIIKNKIID